MIKSLIVHDREGSPVDSINPGYLPFQPQTPDMNQGNRFLLPSFRQSLMTGRTISKSCMQHRPYYSPGLIMILSILWTLSAHAQIAWSPEVNITIPGMGNNHPRIALNAKGELLVVWGHNGQVKFSRWNGSAFTSPISLNPVGMNIAEADWMGPDISAKGDTVYVVFKQIPEHLSSSGIWCKASHDGGKSFFPAIRVDHPSDSLSRFPTVDVDKLGNPIVAFMHFSPNFQNPQWRIARSFDTGLSFEFSKQASGWSDENAVVCDCCPGTIISYDSIICVLYRDNNDNIRDIWAGISTDMGQSFQYGINADLLNWYIQSCPASGPDGVIIGDTLYSVSMNGVNGQSHVYFNRMSIHNQNNTSSTWLTGPIVGLAQQNFPRLDVHSNLMVIAWKQIVNGTSQIPVWINSNIQGDLDFDQYLIEGDGIVNVDLKVSSDMIHVVWQNSSGHIKWRFGQLSTSMTETDFDNSKTSLIWPNPSNDGWWLRTSDQTAKSDIILLNTFGTSFAQSYVEQIDKGLYYINGESLLPGIYFLHIMDNHRITSHSLIRY